MNDGSTDAATLSVLNDLAAKDCTILHHKNKGAAAARNAGVKASAGKYYFFFSLMVMTGLEKGILIKA